MQSFNPAYTGPRREVARLVPPGCSRILDVGCATGSLGAFLKRASPRIQIVGVELDVEMAEVARKRLDRVIVGSIVDLLEDALADEVFDCILLADVLEHLEDPWRLLSQLGDHLSKDGVVIASIPNVRHYTTLMSLLFGKYWPYRDRGIHDRTHLRFFAQRNVEQLFPGAGLRVERLDRNYRIIEAPHRLNRWSWLLAVPPFRDLLTFQYYVVARRAVLGAGGSSP